MHRFIELCTLFEKLESLQSRNEMSLLLSEYLKTCTGPEVEIVSYMIQGRVAPMFVKSEFNYSEKSLINLLTNYTSLEISLLRKESGDIGDTVFKIWEERKQKGSILDTSEIYRVLWEIVNISGIGSVTEKDRVIIECLKKLNPLESKYFVRIICGQLRLGLNVKTLLDVFSISVTGDKELRKDLERAYGVCADIGYIGSEVVGESYIKAKKKLSRVTVTPGVPILSRLVQRVSGFDELEERFEKDVLVQPKFDGLRCQIHRWSSKERRERRRESIWERYILDNNKMSHDLFTKASGESINVHLFTRNLEDVTDMFPEIVESAKEIESPSFILDTEVVGWDYGKNRFMSYQKTMQRRRKYSIKTTRDRIPVRAFVFDILYLNGKSLINEDTYIRVKDLEKTLELPNRGIVMSETKRVSVGEEVKEYFNSNVHSGLEGIIVKKIEGGYLPGSRDYSWIKVKKSIKKDLVDTIDMVVVGYYKGSGRRAELGLGAILGAIYNEKEDTFDAICKIGTGMSDDILKEISTKLLEYEMSDKPKNVNILDNLIPDVWVLPKYVITVDADEITKNISKASKTVGGGLSLRFPRLVVFDRDKGIEDITTVEELVQMYSMRKHK